MTLPNDYSKSFDSWKNNNATPMGKYGNAFSPPATRANALAHEGEHVYQFNHGMTQKKFDANPVQYERDAYRAGNSVSAAYGSPSPFPEP